MKGKILVLIIGILIGAIIATAGFLIYNKVVVNNEEQSGNMQGGQMGMPNGGDMENTPEMPEGGKMGDAPEMSEGDNMEEPPEKPEGDNLEEPSTNSNT